ncbi:MAG: hypothetical protein Q3976_10225 [Corynebacterium sp.]|nr:hypothetical protein [Corynebacterium sp.]
MGNRAPKHRRLAHRTLFATSLSASLSVAVTLAQMTAPQGTHFSALAGAETTTNYGTVKFDANSGSADGLGVAVFDKDGNRVEANADGSVTLPSQGTFTVRPTFTANDTEYVFYANNFVATITGSSAASTSYYSSSISTAKMQVLNSRSGALEDFLNDVTDENIRAVGARFLLDYVQEGNTDDRGYTADIVKDFFTNLAAAVRALASEKYVLGDQNPGSTAESAKEAVKTALAFGTGSTGMETMAQSLGLIPASLTGKLDDSETNANLAANIASVGDATVSQLFSMLNSAFSGKNSELSTVGQNFVESFTTITHNNDDSTTADSAIQDLINNYKFAFLMQTQCSAKIEDLKKYDSVYYKIDAELTTDHPLTTYKEQLEQVCPDSKDAVGTSSISVTVDEDGKLTIPDSVSYATLVGSVSNLFEPSVTKPIEPYTEAAKTNGDTARLRDEIKLYLKTTYAKPEQENEFTNGWDAEIDAVNDSDAKVFYDKFKALASKITEANNVIDSLSDILNGIGSIQAFASESTYYSALLGEVTLIKNTLTGAVDAFNKSRNSSTLNKLLEAKTKASEFVAKYNTATMPTTDSLNALSAAVKKANLFVYGTATPTAITPSLAAFATVSGGVAASQLLAQLNAANVIFNDPTKQTDTAAKDTTAKILYYLAIAETALDTALKSNDNYTSARRALEAYKSEISSSQFELLLANLNSIADNPTELVNFQANLPRLFELLSDLETAVNNADNVRTLNRYTLASDSSKAAYDNLILVARAEVQNKDKYSVSSFAGNTSRTIASLVTMLSAINNAYNQLDGVTRVNSALSYLSVELKLYSSVVYGERYRNSTSDIRDAYRDAYESGKQILDKSNAGTEVYTYDEIVAATDKARAARLALNGKSDLEVAKERLQAAILVNNVVSNGLNDLQKNALEAAMAKIENDGDLRNLEQTVITIAREQGVLQETISESTTVSKSARYVYANSEARKQYDDAVNAAQELINTKADVDTADDLTESQRSIMLSIQNLSGVSPNASALQAAIDGYYDTTASLAYTGSNSDLRLAYVTAVAEARFVLADPSSTDEQMKAALDQINAARSQLNGDLPRKIVLWGFGASSLIVLIGYIVSQVLGRQNAE